MAADEKGQPEQEKEGQSQAGVIGENEPEAAYAGEHFCKAQGHGVCYGIGEDEGKGQEQKYEQCPGAVQTGEALAVHEPLADAGGHTDGAEEHEETRTSQHDT